MASDKPVHIVANYRRCLEDVSVDKGNEKGLVQQGENCSAGDEGGVGIGDVWSASKSFRVGGHCSLFFVSGHRTNRENG